MFVDEHAHEDIAVAGIAAAADRGRETVTAVSYRWGFPSRSRFAVFYRQAYGVSPGRTLRS